ncbi:poly-beta-1,6 N-acetyl-D-glucosamine synthase [Acinetobacter proteolyticus]|jgi:biofilm PGA synthesis N-glycosyltransferase PgaC|uniref:Poly-beta-1,6-N-acetyl-D-glucosamine synthase n=1 Tax=Acinetobacter proteolyticus TaxID=1776741 RepID=A0A653K918_9GAMM|nr:poly-beta-1,6-N-acetyl-D-glucosamine synthase [Acinetobacter proteolyticus]OEY94543.1 poly-beta-1,6 N-acetyl-D-glucosamine synthase [Acinetobacter proteolyticus]QHH94696.1 poly-beta-1,6 N-acetyl-D-glucosamine synthase [Acinetobacter gyllenbergii]VXA57220.1 putative glycosyl transferase associated with biofilm formation [Acinetobacter proteolyticus]
MTLMETLFLFAFIYPLLMAWTWMVGGLWFYFKREYKQNQLPEISEQGCSIIIPCFNEQAQVRETLRFALQTQYPKFEVIAVNDGSSDDTAKILDELALEHPDLRVVHLAENQGKAFALRSGMMVSQYEYLICIDGDALLHPHAAIWMMHQLTAFNQVGAVTGNPRILNRSSILGKLQVGEFSSIIGLIKRAQRTYGRIFTVSGVIAGFRKTALMQVGLWSEDKITEDIDISWKLQLAEWDIHYVPNALCYIYMPETFKGLWKQRLRWAQGGVEVIKTYFPKLFKISALKMWPVALEAIISMVWAYVILLIIILFFLGLFVPLSAEWQIKSLFPQWYGVILAITCLIQFFVSLFIDRRYDGNRFLRNYFWVIWYPLFFWMLGAATTVVAVPKALFTRNKRARWISPDRGFKGESE